MENFDWAGAILQGIRSMETIDWVFAALFVVIIWWVFWVRPWKKKDKKKDEEVAES